MIRAEKIRVGFVTHSLSRSAGGVFPALRRLTQALHEHEVAPATFGVADAHAAEDLPTWAPVETTLCAPYGPRGFGYAPELRRRLRRCDAQLLHTHGLWMYPSLAARQWAEATRKPYLVTPHGMLDPWALRQSRWKKRLAGLLYEDAHLRGAACLHALCTAEAESFRSLGLRNPICVIPNGVDGAEWLHGSIPQWRREIGVDKKVLLYLGRIHPKKGLAELLHAWSLVQTASPELCGAWRLAIAGWSQDEHETELRRIAERLGIAASVHFLGPCFDAEKAAAYAHADGFILPSRSEGLPVVVLEACAAGLPVLMTRACHLPELVAEGAATEIVTEPEGLSQQLIAWFRQSDGERRAMGTRGRALVAERFAWSKIAVEMRRVYEWVLFGGAAPSSVWMD